MKYALPLLLLVCAAPALAETPSPEQQLEQVQQELSSRQSKAAEIDSTMARTERELKFLQQQLVQAAAAQQKVDANIIATEARLKELSELSAAKNTELQGKRQSLAEMLGLMQRFAHTPPAAILLESTEPAQIAMAQQQLQAIVPSLNTRLAELSTTVNELRTIEAQVAAERTLLASQREKMAADQAKLNQLLKKRQAKLKETQRLSETERKKVTELAATAADLEGLVKQLKERRKAAPNKGEPVWIGGEKAKHLPAAGYAMAQFGEVDRLGTPSRGISLKTSPSLPVVAVAKGNVAFAGPFRGYGKMVIVEHAGGWHTVTAGMADISVDVGQKVEAGEPIGRIGNNNSLRELYFEVRQNGQPVDPLGPIAAKLTNGQNR